MREVKIYSNINVYTYINKYTYHRNTHYFSRIKLENDKKILRRVSCCQSSGDLVYKILYTSSPEDQQCETVSHEVFILFYYFPILYL